MFKAQRAIALAGVLALLLAACGPAATATPQPTATTAAATATPVVSAPTATKPAPTSTPAPSPTPGIRAGGKIRVVTPEPTTIDPHAQGTPFPEAWHIFDPLMRLDHQLQLAPALAESWSVTDPTTIVFKLRKGVKFHDGSPFNAQVVKWNFDRIANPETVSPVARPGIASVGKVEVVDDYTIKLNLNRPASDLMFYLGTVQLSMMTPTAVEKWGKDVGAHPVGTGPYIFKDWMPARSTRMTRNPGYWDSPRPYIEEVEWVITQDESVTVASLRTGAMDLAFVALPSNVERLEKEGMKVYSELTGLTQGLFLNHLRPPMDNLDFRRALDLAIDREALSKAFTAGQGILVSSLFPPNFPEYNGALSPAKRDVARAKELVARSGYKGEVLELACSTAGDVPKVCEALQAQFKEIGVNFEFNVAAGTAAFSRALGQLLYHIATINSNHLPLQVRAQMFLQSGGRLNSGRFGDTPEARKVDQLITEISSAYDWNTQKRLFDELQKVVYDNVLDIYIMNRPRQWVGLERVQNYQVFPTVFLAYTWLKD